ncbi:MAG: hypothetical protein WAX12_02180 [Candidatus Microthrix subdominans]
MRDVPLSGDQIRRYLGEVARSMGPGGPQHTLILVGGSLLAWHGLRQTTLDVDSVRRLDAELSAAAALVAKRHGLPPRWLNSNAQPFAPVTLKESECEVLAEYPRLKLLGAPWSQIFVMKLYAGREQDREDLAAIWSRTGFASADAAARMFREAYPHAPDDEFLSTYIETAVAQAPNGSEAI